MTTGFRDDGWYRSVLYLPAHREDARDVIATTVADCVMLDLEDGVPEPDKERARAAAGHLARERWKPLVALRVNKVASGMIGRDLEVALGEGIDVVILPKAESEADLKDLDRAIAAIEEARGMQHGRVRMIALVETCAGALAAPRLALSSPRILTLGIGASDFMADIGRPVSRAVIDFEALSLARRMLVLAARAAGHFGPFDGGKFEPGRAGWKEACEEVRRLGMQGKVCFDEEQARGANEVFAARPGETCSR